MTDQPKPTPGPWKIFDGWGAKALQPIVVDSIPDVDGKCVANCICYVSTTNPDALANAALIARAPELLAENAELADLRTAADQCEALSKDLADHKQLLVIKNRQLDTMAADNQRLRELLRRVGEAAERDDFGSVGCELVKEIKHAIGRTGE